MRPPRTPPWSIPDQAGHGTNSRLITQRTSIATVAPAGPPPWYSRYDRAPPSPHAPPPAVPAAGARARSGRRRPGKVLARRPARPLAAGQMTSRIRTNLATSPSMSSAVRHITVDCHDAYALARFCAEVLGGRVHEDDHPGEPEALIIGFEPPLLFVQVAGGQDRQEPDPPRSPAAGSPPGRRGRARPRVGRHRGERPAPAGRDRLGCARRPRGQRVLRRARPGRPRRKLAPTRGAGAAAGAGAS